MPLYEYKCTKCGNDYEVIKGFSEDADHDICPDCKGPQATWSPKVLMKGMQRQVGQMFFVHRGM